MSASGTVLVLTHWFDPTADHVIEELNRRGAPVMRFDTADFPRRLSITGRSDGGPVSGHLSTGRRTVALEDVRGAYFRRPTAFDFGAMAEPGRSWATAEARAGLGGMLMASRRWINHPHFSGYAAYKPVQLDTAAAVGLRIPATIITNAPDEARAFVASVGTAVYKPLTSTSPGRGRALYAAVVAAEDLEGGKADGVRSTTHLFQERIAHEHAVRLTVVDERMFATAIHAHSAAAARDWRADYDALTYAPIAVPDQIRCGVLRLMRGLHLRFAALDFLVCPERGWVFLEANPNGQWAWIEQATGQPIASAIADALTRRET